MNRTGLINAIAETGSKEQKPVAFLLIPFKKKTWMN